MKLNLNGLRAQSSCERISNDLRILHKDRRRTNSFAVRSIEDQENADSLKQYNFDFDADSDSIESFDSTKMTNSLPAFEMPPQFTSF